MDRHNFDHQPYPPAELELLALLFTLVKILFLKGAFQPIPAVIDLIEPLRLGKNLHLTITRNEHAYYCCVAALMRTLPFPLPDPTVEEIKTPSKKGGKPIVSTRKNVIFVCGDSHCLSSAWHTVSIQGNQYQLTPRLVTGVKCWHLRPESSFYPKANFERAVGSIPTGSRVIFIVGEIDCREGIVLAVERMLYDTIEQGIKAAVQVYITVLEKLARERKFEIFIHPVVPVLDITRSMVIKFNRILEEHVRASKLLRWLDFHQRLLTPEGSLNPLYDLDGTHLSPNYIPLLEARLAAQMSIAQ